MIEYTDLAELTQAFLHEDFLLGSEVQVGDQHYTLTDQTKMSVVDALAGKRPMAVYLAEGEQPSQLVFFWTNKGNTIVPGGVVTTEKALTTKQELVVEMDGQKITIRPDQLIGDIASIKFTSFSSPKELKAKVDTGATISSLHADQYKINGTTVTFVCSHLGPESITVPLKTQHAVKSPDGGTNYRPVVELNVRVNGKLLNNVLFNLNDRGNMDQPVLIGQNLLKQGKLYVDPTRSESVVSDWAELEKVVETAEPADRMDTVHEIYTMLLDSNVNFRDLVHHIRSEAIRTDLEA